MGFQNANIEFQGGGKYNLGGGKPQNFFRASREIFSCPPLNFAREGQKASLRSAAPPYLKSWRRAW